MSRTPESALDPNRKTTPHPILIALLSALAVFTIGLLLITFGLRSLESRTSVTPTVDIAQLPIKPLPQITSPAPTPTGAPTSAPTPTPLPIITDTPAPTATDAPPAAPTTTPTPTATLAPTPYAGPFRANGGDYTAPYRNGIIVDGSLNEWEGIVSIPLAFVQQGAENLESPEDFSVDAQLAWDEYFLYMSAQVTDDVHVQELHSYDMFNGDSIELWLDTRLAEDFDDDTLNGDDFQIGFSPGNFATLPPEGTIWYPTREMDRDRSLVVAVQRRGTGYTLEIATPWSVLDIRPGSGMTFGFAINANDNDAPATASQQTILMHTGNMIWGRPATFSNLRLE